MQKKQIIILIIILLVAMGGSFWAGSKYSGADNKNSSQFSSRSGTRANFSGNRRLGTGFVTGEILSKDDKSITVKIKDSGSRLIFLSSSTTISQSTQTDSSALTTGQTVMINGSPTPDGSLTAQTIQIRNN